MLTARDWLGKYDDMDMFAEVKGLVLSAIERLVAEGRLPRGLDLGGVTVEPPRDPAHGDMATNAAMVLSRPARKGPREIAEACAASGSRAPAASGSRMAMSAPASMISWRNISSGSLPANSPSVGKVSTRIA